MIHTAYNESVARGRRLAVSCQQCIWLIFFVLRVGDPGQLICPEVGGLTVVFCPGGGGVWKKLPSPPEDNFWNSPYARCFRFVTIHAFDRRTDGRTDRHTDVQLLITIPRLHSCSAVKIIAKVPRFRQVAQLSQRNRAAAWVSFGWP